MKHKILLATNASEEFDNLLKDLSNLLNETHKKYISAFSPKNFQSKKLVAANAGAANGFDSLDHLVSNFDRDLALKKLAADLSIHFQWIHEALDHERLSSLSTVSDLLILEQEAFSDGDVSIFEEIVTTVKCPVLLLPKDWEIENLVVFHDGSMDSVKMVKDFINLFNSSLRDLPLSVLISDPMGDYDIEGEKVFIDYLKLFFNNIGIQKIQGQLMDNLTQSIVYNSSKPFLMLGVEDNVVSSQNILESPTFLFKG
ncbi:MAG: hypothetical protein ACI82Q_001760 [Nonlabens sp.]